MNCQYVKEKTSTVIGKKDKLKKILLVLRIKMLQLTVANFSFCVARILVSGSKKKVVLRESSKHRAIICNFVFPNSKSLPFYMSNITHM